MATTEEIREIIGFILKQYGFNDSEKRNMAGKDIVKYLESKGLIKYD